jgi:hypothetical protein
MRSGEYSIKVLAPETADQCDYIRCRKRGTWRLVAVDDKDQSIFEYEYENICGVHLVIEIVRVVLGEE